MQTVVFQGEEKSAGGVPEDVVGWDICEFPGKKLDMVEDWVAFLPGGDEDCRWAVSGWESLWLGLLDFLRWLWLLAGRGCC